MLIKALKLKVSDINSEMFLWEEDMYCKSSPCRHPGGTAETSVAQTESEMDGELNSFLCAKITEYSPLPQGWFESLL